MWSALNAAHSLILLAEVNATRKNIFLENKAGGKRPKTQGGGKHQKERDHCTMVVDYGREILNVLGRRFHGTHYFISKLKHSGSSCQLAFDTFLLHFCP